MIRGIPILLLALLIDFLQAAISFGIVGLGLTIAWIPVIGQVGEGAGFALGIVINMCLSFGLGFVLVLLTILMGFSPLRLFPAFFESVPILNNLPIWTIAALWVVFGKELKKKLAVGGTLQRTMDMVGAESAQRLRQAAPIAATGALSDQQPSRTQRSFMEDGGQSSFEEPRSYPGAIPMQRNIDGIRSAAAKTAVVLLFLFAGSIGTVHAQSADPLRYTVTPDVPGPNEPVLVEIEGVGAFLGDATITWQKNGITVLSGKGERSYSFTNGSLGATTKLRVTIVSTQQGTFTHDFAFTPSVVNLLWEADTSVPPLYRGKALYSAGARVKVVALPSIIAGGTTVSSNNLSFQWSHNGDPVTSASGAGRNTFTFTGDSLRNAEQVGVDVYYGGGLAGHGELTIPATRPSLLLYGRDPLRGALYDQALQGRIALASNEITLYAQPYFFSNQSVGSSLGYGWKLNGNTASGPDSAQGVLTLRQSGGGAGQAVVSTSVQDTNPDRFTQAAQTALTILFGENTSTSPAFGL